MALQLVPMLDLGVVWSDDPDNRGFHLFESYRAYYPPVPIIKARVKNCNDRYIIIMTGAQK